MVETFPRGLLDSAGPPRYVRTAERLWEDLSAAQARHGDRLPGERTLAQRYGVSRVTLRSALGLLQQRGLLAPVQGQGWSVLVESADDTRQSEPAAGPRGSIQGFADFAAEQGLEVRAKVLMSQVRPASHAEAAELRIGPGAELFELRRLRYLDGRVTALERNRVPLAACPSLAQIDFRTASLYAVLRSADPPQFPGLADYAVEARAPDDTERELLQISGPVPLLVATQLTANQHGRPLELTVQAYRGDRYRFEGQISNR